MLPCTGVQAARLNRLSGDTNLLMLVALPGPRAQVRLELLVADPVVL